MCNALRLYFRPEDARITSQNHYLYFSLIFAPVAELADALDLGSSFERSAGSIPVRCTKEESILFVSVLFLLMLTLTDSN